MDDDLTQLLSTAAACKTHTDLCNFRQKIREQADIMAVIGDQVLQFINRHERVCRIFETSGYAGYMRAWEVEIANLDDETDETRHQVCDKQHRIFRKNTNIVCHLGIITVAKKR